MSPVTCGELSHDGYSIIQCVPQVQVDTMSVPTTRYGYAHDIIYHIIVICVNIHIYTHTQTFEFSPYLYNI